VISHIKIHSLTSSVFIISYREVLEEEKDSLDNKLNFREILMGDFESASTVIFLINI
jgi:hypothetical protein